MPGPELIVHPGYQRMNAAQRDCLLILRERGQLKRSVSVRPIWPKPHGRYVWRVTDGTSRYVVYPDGSCKDVTP
jgi:hypothetical protein